MTSGDRRVCRCEGWWEQESFGRQAMAELRVYFGEGRIVGRGVDVIGVFRLDGTLDENGAVAIIKQYVGQHDVQYLGQYDGEGTLSGEWRIGLDRVGLDCGRWAIFVRGFADEMADEIAEIVPR
jgi:hypothetical protein